MPTFSLNIICTIIQVQGDSDINLRLIDRSQTTTNMDSFNVTSSTLTNQSSAPESPLESAPDSDVPLDDVSSLSATSHTMSYQQNDGILQTGSEARTSSTLTSSSMSVGLEDIYPSSQVFAQDQRAGAHPSHNSNRSTDSLDALGSESLNSPPPKKKLCPSQHVINKLKRWSRFHRFFSCLSPSRY